MKLYRPIAEYATTDAEVMKAVIPKFDHFYPEERLDELREGIIQKYPKTFMEVGAKLVFEECYFPTDNSATCSISEDKDEYWGKWLKCDSCGYDHNVVFNKYCGKCGKELTITRKEDFMLHYINDSVLEKWED